MVAFAKNEWVITTPNQEAIPLPPWGVRNVRLRADMRFGLDDPTLWPQFYTLDFPHLAAIPRKPRDSNNFLSIMWWTPTPADFVTSNNNLVRGLGQLSSAKVKIFEESCRELVARVKMFRDVTQNQNTFLQSITQVMRHSCIRLACLPSTFQEMVIGVTEFQRYYLETLGTLDYLQLFKPYMDNALGADSPMPLQSGRIGAFITDPHIAQEFFDAGLPFYFVRTVSEVLATNPRPAILNLIDANHPPDAMLVDADPKFPVIFSGRTIDSKKHGELHKYARTRMVCRDAFGAEHETPDPLSGFVPRANASTTRSMEDLMRPRDIAGGPKRSNSSSPLPLPPSKSLVTSGMSSNFQLSIYLIHMVLGQSTVQRSGNSSHASQTRNKFIDPDSDMIPPSMPAWANALSQVQQSPSAPQQKQRRGKKQTQAPHQGADAPHRGHYALPDPVLLVTPTSDDKKLSYILTWLRARPALLYRIQKRQSTALSAQMWRDFLGMGQSSQTNSATAAAQRRDRIRTIMGPGLMDEAGLSEAPQSETVGDVRWRGTELSLTTLPGTSVVHEIVWELFELNFRLELFGLDRRASIEELEVSTRLQRLQSCFLDCTDLLCINIPRVNVGLVANDWRTRLPFVVNLVKIMSSWGGLPLPPIFNERHRQLDTFSKEAAMELEQQATIFYAQIFYNHFGRAAILPHRILPST